MVAFLNKSDYFFSVSLVYSTECSSKMKKLYALERNGQEIVTVAMDVPDFMPRTTINREWLKGVVTEEIAFAPKPVRRARNANTTRASKVRVAA
jgi:hypothetical protein